MPGNEEEAAGLLNAYLALAAEERPRDTTGAGERR